MEAFSWSKKETLINTGEYGKKGETLLYNRRQIQVSVWKKVKLKEIFQREKKTSNTELYCKLSKSKEKMEFKSQWNIKKGQNSLQIFIFCIKQDPTNGLIFIFLQFLFLMQACKQAKSIW